MRKTTWGRKITITQRKLNIFVQSFLQSVDQIKVYWLQKRSLKNIEVGLSNDALCASRTKVLLTMSTKSIITPYTLNIFDWSFLQSRALLIFHILSVDNFFVTHLILMIIELYSFLWGHAARTADNVTMGSWRVAEGSKIDKSCWYPMTCWAHFMHIGEELSAGGVFATVPVGDGVILCGASRSLVKLFFSRFWRRRSLIWSAISFWRSTTTWHLAQKQSRNGHDRLCPLRRFTTLCWAHRWQFGRRSFGFPSSLSSPLLSLVVSDWLAHSIWSSSEDPNAIAKVVGFLSSWLPSICIRREFNWRRRSTIIQFEHWQKRKEHESLWFLRFSRSPWFRHLWQ